MSIPTLCSTFIQPAAAACYKLPRAQPALDLDTLCPHLQAGLAPEMLQALLVGAAHDDIGVQLLPSCSWSPRVSVSGGTVSGLQNRGTAGTTNPCAEASAVSPCESISQSSGLQPMLLPVPCSVVKLKRGLHLPGCISLRCPLALDRRGAGVAAGANGVVATHDCLPWLLAAALFAFACVHGFANMFLK